MEFELKLEKTRFILRESIKVEVVFRNTGRSPVQAPSPSDNRNKALRYTLSGPSFPSPFSFDYGGSNTLRMPGDPEMETLQPGEESSTPITIERYWKDWKVGKHTLRAALEGVGEAKPLEFEILEPEVLSAQVLTDASARPSTFMRALFLARTGPGAPPTLYQAFFPEAEPDVETTPEGNIVEAGVADSRAKQVTGAWTNFDRSSVLFSRFGWSSPNGLVGIQEFKGTAIVETGPNVRQVRPAIMNQQGDVFWLGFAGRQASLWRIPRPGGQPPGRVWTSELPFVPAASRFTVSSLASGSKQIAGFLAQEGETVRAVLIGGDGTQISTILLAENAVLTANAEPGLSIDDELTVRLSVLVSDPKDPKALRVVEWSRKATESEYSLRSSPAFTVPRQVEAAGVVYSSPGVAPRRDWLVLLSDGTIVTNRDPGRPRAIEGKAVVPLEFLPRPQMTYLLATHPKEVVYLAPMF